MTPDAPARPVRVLVVEDHRVLAESLAALLSRSRFLEVAGIATTVAEAISTAERLDPDVLLMDLRLPDGSGAEAAATIRGRRQRPAVIFLTGDERTEALAEAIEAGGAAFVSKAEATETVIDAITRVAEGEMLIRPDQVQRALLERRATRQREREREQALRRLTARELEILRLLAMGRDASAIARQLRISLLTVRTHVRSLLAKLDAHTQLEAVARAQVLGILVQKADA